MKKNYIEGLWYDSQYFGTAVQRRVVDGKVEGRNNAGAFESDMDVEQFSTRVKAGTLILHPGQTSPVERVRRVLKTLAERKDIAGYLAKKGIRGLPGSCCSCIIAAFVKKTTGENIEVYPWDNGEPGIRWETNGKRYSLHPRLVTLARYFDDYKLPELCLPA